MNIHAIPKHFWRGPIGLILMAALAACVAPAQIPTVELTVEAILTSTRPTAIIPTLTPTSEATATSKPNRPSTRTPTLASDSLPEVKPTQAPLKSAEDRAPNGWWSAQGWGEFRGETYHAELRVTRADGQVKWIARQEFNAGLGVPVPTPLEWSQDGRYLYYTNVPLVDGYVCSIPVNGSDLWRMDLTDGSVTQLVPDVGLSVSLSPDEGTFAYVSFGPQQDLVLRNLATGEERRVSLPADTQAGGIVWSLDSSVMMLTVAEEPCSGEAKHSIVRVDANLLTYETVLPESEDDWMTVEWADRGLVLLQGKNYYRYLDPTTNNLEQTSLQKATRVSPDGKWLVTIQDVAGPPYQELLIIRTDGSAKFIVRDVTIENDAHNWALGWSPDSRYLYFTESPATDGYIGMFINGTNLRRLDLQNGKVVEIMTDEQTKALSLSPDASKVAYLIYSDTSTELVIRNLMTQLELRTTLSLDAWNKAELAGNIIWSPDMKSLVFTVDIAERASSIIKVDVSTLEQITLFNEDVSRLWAVAWLDNQTVLLKGANGGDYWQLDFLTGALTVPTRVPQNLSPN